MVVRRISDTIDKWIGLSTDQKPPVANIGSWFVTEDNNDVFVMLKTGWTNISVLGGGVDHGELSGLADDDHVLYLPVDGSRNALQLITFENGVYVYNESTFQNGPVNVNGEVNLQGLLNFTPTATHDIGFNNLRPRDILLSRNLTVGGALDHEGSTVGFYGVAPVARQLLATGAGASVDNVITALQNLGLVRQS